MSLEHTRSHIAKISRLYKNPLHSDVTILCKNSGERIHAHLAILATHTNYFTNAISHSGSSLYPPSTSSLFTHTPAPCKPEVSIELDVPPAVVKAAVKYCYSGNYCFYELTGTENTLHSDPDPLEYLFHFMVYQFAEFYHFDENALDLPDDCRTPIDPKNAGFHGEPSYNLPNFHNRTLSDSSSYDSSSGSINGTLYSSSTFPRSSQPVQLPGLQTLSAEKLAETLLGDEVSKEYFEVFWKEALPNFINKVYDLTRMEPVRHEVLRRTVEGVVARGMKLGHGFEGWDGEVMRRYRKMCGRNYEVRSGGLHQSFSIGLGEGPGAGPRKVQWKDEMDDTRERLMMWKDEVEMAKKRLMLMRTMEDLR